MRVLLTGGLGYIGSHVAVELSSRGHEPFIVDNLCNAKVANLDKVACLSPRKPALQRRYLRILAVGTNFRRENFDVYYWLGSNLLTKVSNSHVITIAIMWWSG